MSRSSQAAAYKCWNMQERNPDVRLFLLGEILVLNGLQPPASGEGLKEFVPRVGGVGWRRWDGLNNGQWRRWSFRSGVGDAALGGFSADGPGLLCFPSFTCCLLSSRKSVIQTQLGELVLQKSRGDGTEGRAEVHKQNPGTDSSEDWGPCWQLHLQPRWLCWWTAGGSWVVEF